MAAIQGVTLYRPWSAAIAYFGKDIENRSWACPVAINSYLAIHAGSTWDESADKYIREFGRLTNPDLVGWKSDYLDKTKNHHKGAIIAVAQFKGNLTGHPSKWFEGPIGWKLENVLPIEPVYCRGQQNIWDIPEDILKQVRMNYGESQKQSLVN